MTEKLETRLLNYFLLIAFAAMLIGVEFFFEMNRPNLTQEICSIAQQSESLQSGTAANSHPLTQLRNKIVVMFGVLSFVVAIVLMMFIKNITTPLSHIAEIAQRINEGDLSQTVSIETNDEIGQVGEAINELTSNLQEVASFTCITTMEILDKFNALTDTLGSTSPNQENLKNIKHSLKSLIEFVDSFKLLHTDIAK